MCPCLTPGPFSFSQGPLCSPHHQGPELVTLLDPSSWHLYSSLCSHECCVSLPLCDHQCFFFLLPLINVSQKAFDLEWMYLWASIEKFYGFTQRFPMLCRIRGIFQIWFWVESNLFLSVICCQAVSSLECEACDEGRLTHQRGTAAHC